MPWYKKVAAPREGAPEEEEACASGRQSPCVVLVSGQLHIASACMITDPCYSTVDSSTVSQRLKGLKQLSKAGTRHSYEHLRGNDMREAVFIASLGTLRSSSSMHSQYSVSYWWMSTRSAYQLISLSCPLKPLHEDTQCVELLLAGTSVAQPRRHGYGRLLATLGALRSISSRHTLKAAFRFMVLLVFRRTAPQLTPVGSLSWPCPLQSPVLNYSTSYRRCFKSRRKRPYSTNRTWLLLTCSTSFLDACRTLSSKSSSDWCNRALDIWNVSRFVGFPLRTKSNSTSNRSFLSCDMHCRNRQTWSVGLFSF